MKMISKKEGRTTDTSRIMNTPTECCENICNQFADKVENAKVL
jgi:hypothetical protein